MLTIIIGGTHYLIIILISHDQLRQSDELNSCHSSMNHHFFVNVILKTDWSDVHMKYLRSVLTLDEQCCHGGDERAHIEA